MSTVGSQQGVSYVGAQDSPATDGSRLAEEGGILAKGKKLLGLGKKRAGAGEKKEKQEVDKTARPVSQTLLPSPALTTSPSDRRASPRGSPRVYPAGIGASPGRRIRSSSPGLHSPASSQIFERNVQEPEESSAIPAHIKTEDYIPPALDASSLAITDSHLNPDDVEIVMHSAHQPASAAVAGSMAESVHSPSLKHDDAAGSSAHQHHHHQHQHPHHAEMTESASNYGSLDMTDPRRLSFISFADVVQAEHIEHDREPMGSSDAMQFLSLDSTAADRSPSPPTTTRTTTASSSSHGRTPSSLASGAASPLGVVQDYGRTRSPGSPTSLAAAAAATTHDPSLGAELPLQIETMRQALRKTRSGDLSGARPQPLGVSVDDGAGDQQLK